MNPNPSQPRFTSKQNTIYDNWYGEILEKTVIPYSSQTFDYIKHIAEYYCSFTLNIIHYFSDNFEITVFSETMGKKVDSSQITSIPDKSYDQILFQAHAIFDIVDKENLNFVDFSQPNILPNWQLKFPFLHPSTVRPKTKNLSSLLNTIDGLFGKNHKNRIDTHFHFKNWINQLSNLLETQLELFCFSDFSTKILLNYPMGDFDLQKNLKIKITAGSEIQKRFITNQIFTSLNSDLTYFLNFNKNLKDFPYLRKILSSPSNSKPEMIKMISEFWSSIDPLTYTGGFIFLDHFDQKVESEFIHYLINTSIQTNTIIIIFMDFPFIHFDLELIEKNNNKMNKYTQATIVANNLVESPHIFDILKIFKVINFPIPSEVLKRIFPGKQMSLIKSLLSQQILREDKGHIGADLNPILSSITTTKKEKKEILIKYLPVINSQAARIRLCLETNDIKTLNQILSAQLKSDKSCDIQDLISPSLMFEYPFLKKNPKTTRLIILLLVSENQLELAAEILTLNRSTDPAFMDCKLAHIHKLNKHYSKMKSVLSKIGKIIEPDIAQEVNYLNYVYYEKKGDRKKADSFFKLVISEKFKHLSNNLLADRFIYKKSFKSARGLLNPSLRYFHKNRMLRAKLDTLNQFAKLFREESKHQAAEKLYRFLFTKCNIVGFLLMAADTATDLGNLYLKEDNFDQSEVWYKKAKKIFSKLHSQVGTTLAESNLLEILKFKGEWLKTEEQLTDVLLYDREKSNPSLVAIDLFNIAHLKYLKFEFTEAIPLLDQAVELFKQQNNIEGAIECSLLKLKISIKKEDIPFDLSYLRSQKRHFMYDRIIQFEFFEKLLMRTNIEQPQLIISRLNKIQSSIIRFETAVLLYEKLKRPDILKLLKDISSNLCQNSKNYFYHEYHFIYFLNPLNTNKLTEREKERFYEMYYFFTLNGRLLPDELRELKNNLDRSKQKLDIFNSHRLLSDYIQWQVPEDFFKRICIEIRHKEHLPLIKLALFENGRPIFHFSDPIAFNDIGKELIEFSLKKDSSLNLNLDEIKELLKTQEKLIFPFPVTKTIQWAISKNLTGILLLSSKRSEFYSIDFFDQHKDLLDKLGSLIQKFYNFDFKVSEHLNFIIGKSKAIQDLKIQILKVARVDFSLLISGESGTGKELVAKAVHRMSHRASGPFIAVNSAAIPEHLLEAELFGYRKGSFTGASESRIGLIQAADGGSLFLDEIGDLSLNLQAKLLRVLQENEIRRIGDIHPTKVEIRLICATNRDISTKIKESSFREDLYYRIQDLKIQVPSLRDRLDDIPLLSRHFLKKNGFDMTKHSAIDKFIRSLRNRDWEGNIRELESIVKRFITFYPHEDGQENKKYIIKHDLRNARESWEREFLKGVLEEFNWNRTQAAEKLGISRMSLFNLIKKYGISVKEI